MRYWCANCGEPGVCTVKTKTCGYCGYVGISEYDEKHWREICRERGKNPKPHSIRGVQGALETKSVLDLAEE